jgi:hypothetical protein
VTINTAKTGVSDVGMVTPAPVRHADVTIPIFRKLPKQPQVGGLLGTVSNYNLSGAIVREQNATTGNAGAVCFIRIVVELTKVKARTALPSLVLLAEIDLADPRVTADSITTVVPAPALSALVNACSIALCTARGQRLSCYRASF